jgi:4-hydroxy-tetrahydrodipicolinate synthase
MPDLDRLKGSFPPVVTPFRDGEIDYRAYAELVEFQVRKGSHGILVNGTTAEPSTLTTDERNKLVDIAIETVAGKLPVAAATGSQSLAESEILTKHAAKAGADAVLVVTPYYIRPPQRGLIEYYLKLAGQHDTPWMIYHIPGRTAINVTLDSMKELREKSATFIGMKHAVNDLGFVTECFAALGNDFKVFVGLEELSFPMMTIGACGLMNAVGNLRPDVLAEMCEAVWASDLRKGRELHQRLLEINQSVFYDTNPIPMKYMMKKLGLLPTNEHRLPMMAATPELERRLDGVLERAGLL